MSAAIIIGGVLVVLLLILLTWYGVSHRLLHKPIADECTLRRGFQHLTKELRLDVTGFDPEANHLQSGDVCLRLYVLRSPTPNSPTVVFMPGTGAYAEFYCTLLMALNERGFNVVGYDPRGHGRSSGLRGSFTIPEMVEDAQAVIRYAKERFRGKVGMAGSSQGGVVAFYAAAAHTNELSSVACHNFAVLDGVGNLSLSTFQPPRFLVPILTALFRHMGRFVVPVTFYLPFRTVHMPYGLNAETLMKGDPLATLAYSLRALASLSKTPMPRPVAEIETPVMLLGSTEEEVFVPAYVEPIFDQLTCKKKYVNLDGLYHLMIVTDVSKLIGPLAEWFDETLRE